MLDDIFLKSYISSEDDIPEEYKEQINNEVDVTLSDEYIPGKLGQALTLLNEFFLNESNYYFGHGTSVSDEIINAIANEGLKVKDPEEVRGYMDTLRGLDSTTIAFGPGNKDLFKNQENLLNNWPHKGARNVVIVSLPMKYVLDTQSSKVGTDYFEPYYIGSEEKGYRLRPEFILGVYNADEKSMRLNGNYYTNLSKEAQAKLFESVEERYAVSYSEYGIKEPNKEFFSNEENYKKSTILWYKKQLEELKRFEKDREERIKAAQEQADSLIGDFEYDDENIGWDSWDSEEEKDENKKSV